MWCVIVFTLAVLTSPAHSKCDGGCNTPVKHYEEMGCTPIYTAPTDCCPKSYDCSKLKQRSPDKCYYKGKEYQPRERLDESAIGGHCLASCYCDPSSKDIFIPGSHFTCAHIDCPEFFGMRLGKDCYWKYSFTKCCATGSVCPPFDNIAKCEYEGKTYYEGQGIETKNGCLSCICQKDFKGKLEEPFCKPMECGIEIIYSKNMMANHPPIYYGTERCCPIGWQEPSEEDTITSSKTSGSESGDVCHYGKTILKIGDKVSPKGRDNIKCECKIPPMVTCVQDDC